MKTIVCIFVCIFGIQKWNFTKIMCNYTIQIPVTYWKSFWIFWSTTRVNLWSPCSSSFTERNTKAKRIVTNQSKMSNDYTTFSEIWKVPISTHHCSVLIGTFRYDTYISPNSQDLKIWIGTYSCSSVNIKIVNQCLHQKVKYALASNTVSRIQQSKINS